MLHKGVALRPQHGTPFVLSTQLVLSTPLACPSTPPEAVQQLLRPGEELEKASCASAVAPLPSSFWLFVVWGSRATPDRLAPSWFGARMFLGRGAASVTAPRVRRGDPEVPWPELPAATVSPASAAAQRRLEQASARAKASPRASAAARAASSPAARHSESEPTRQSVTFRTTTPPPIEAPSQGQAGPSPSRPRSVGSKERARRWSTEGDSLEAPPSVQQPAEAVEVGSTAGRESARELSREAYESRKPSVQPSRDAGNNSRSSSCGGGGGGGFRSKDGKRLSVSSSSRRSSSSAGLHG